MEAAPSITASSVGFYTVLAIFIALIIGGVSYLLMANKDTVPSGKWTEGFQGPVFGVSHIPCGQESAEASALVQMFVDKESTTEEGNADLAELKLILSKLCCIKHDLMAPAQVIQSTLALPYQNTHDRENPADLVARCFNKSIPPRDLDISFATWKNRGLELLGRSCTSFNLNHEETEQAKKYFMGLWTDVFAIAKTVSTPPEKGSNESPRDPTAFTPEGVQELGPYKGYY